LKQFNKGGNTMAKAVMITYECNRCGTEIVVSPAEGGRLSPIYCCGIGVTEISSVEKKPAKAKKTVKKVVEKVIKKKVTQKKKLTVKKKTTRK
jgi:uncharacterized Zn finger protein (UPF0148 family)